MRQIEQMLNELESHQLHVVLVPLNPKLRGWNEGGCKRVKADQNPMWYRLFCGRHQSQRGLRRGKFDTRIKRKNTEITLRRMLAGRAAGKYADELLALAVRLA